MPTPYDTRNRTGNASDNAVLSLNAGLVRSKNFDVDHDPIQPNNSKHLPLPNTYINLENSETFDRSNLKLISTTRGF